MLLRRRASLAIVRGQRRCPHLVLMARDPAQDPASPLIRLPNRAYSQIPPGVIAHLHRRLQLLSSRRHLICTISPFPSMILIGSTTIPSVPVYRIRTSDIPAFHRGRCHRRYDSIPQASRKSSKTAFNKILLAISRTLPSLI